MNTITSMLSKTVTKVKVKGVKYGPAIAITTGLIGMAGAVYLTYRATTKIEKDRRERDEELNLVDVYRENGSIDHDDGSVVAYTEEDAERDTKIYNSRFIVNCVKHLAPAAALFILSTILITKGFKTEVKRLATMGVALAGATTQINSIRDNLVEEFGKEKANDIMLGKRTHTENEINEETGEVASKEVETTDRMVSGYTFEFSKASSPMLFSGNPQMDKALIEGNQRHANWLLNEKQGHVLFNDILDSFEVKRVGYGCTDGSVETPGHTIIFDVDERTDGDGNGYYIISVNHQGYIADKI